MKIYNIILATLVILVISFVGYNEIFAWKIHDLVTNGAYECETRYGTVIHLSRDLTKYEEFDIISGKKVGESDQLKRLRPDELYDHQRMVTDKKFYFINAEGLTSIGYGFSLDDSTESLCGYRSSKIN